jgi:PAS domain S-box-containing protein
MQQEPLKILLIEHDPGFTRHVGEMLGRAHDLCAEMRSAPDMLEGLARLRGEDFDVVLVDVCAPDGAGLANIALVRAEAPDLAVIAAGEADDETVALEAVHAGAQDYLVKSQINPGWLERSIRYAIERQRTDAALHAAEERYHSIFDHLVEGIFRTTPDGHYMMANTALARIYGYATPDELMQSVTDIGRRLYVDPHRREEFVRIMREHDTITGFESPIYRKDGSVIWISENCRAIRDSGGQLRYYEGTVEDITQRRATEDNLRNSEALYHSLVETLPQNIFRKDLEGRFTFANQQFCKVLNRRLDEIVGKTDFDFFPEPLARKYQEDDRKVLTSGKPYDSVEENQPPGGSKLYVQVVKTPLYDADGKPVGLQGIFWDITEQRMAEERIRHANALLAKSQKELHERNLQMEANLKMAREIQVGMLPQQYPSFPQTAACADSLFQFTHRYLPTGEVGGDFFSVSALSDTQAAVLICDVTGHGVRSALITAMVRALIEELKPVAGDPGQFLTKLNNELRAILQHAGAPMLTTAFYLVADCQTGLMRYSNAGHPKPFHLKRKSGTVVPLANATNTPRPALGFVQNTVYATSETQLESNDLVMLFTDGLFEVESPGNKLYTQAMLLSEVQSRLNLPASDLFDQLLAEITRFTGGKGFDDDVCMVAMETRFPASES